MPVVRPTLSVAICTMNRPGPLANTLASVCEALGGFPASCEILVVDDGELDPGPLERLVASAGLSFRYVRKAPSDRGLYRSRVVAANEAGAPIILFLDDDVSVRPGYFVRLLGAFANDPTLAGLGGVDVKSLPDGNGMVGELYARLFLISSGNPGKLSPSGLNFSQSLWRSRSAPFESEFLHGCNMAFRKAALLDLPDLPWLNGHAPFEDLVLSAVALRHGRLLVDPGLSIEHHAVPGGRGDPVARIRAKIGNQREFLRFARGKKGLGSAALAVSRVGLFLKDLAKSVARPASGSPREVLRGYLGR